MENLRPEKENITKDTTNLLILNKELNYTGIKDIRTLFKLENEIKVIKTRILRDIKNLFEYKE